MTVHGPHASIAGYGLADGCNRCNEHARKPLDGLDDGNLAELVRRVRNQMSPRSANEGIAMAKVMDGMTAAERLKSAGG